MNYKNKFVKIDFDPVNKIANIQWTDDTIFMSDDEYKKIVLDILFYVKKFQLHYILNNMLNFKTVISIEIQQWLKENFLNELMKLSFLKKIAIIAPNDYALQISINQLFENKYFQSLPIKLFKSVSEAELWLFFNK